MSRRRLKALNMDEIIELLQQDEGKNYGDVIIIPPNVDGLTDDEDFEDEGETGEAIIQDVPGSLELHTKHEIEETIDLNEGNSLISPATNRRKKRKLCDSVPKWRHTQPQYTKVKQRDGGVGEACEVEGRMYPSETAVPRDHPCHYCICFQGQVSCYWKSCGPAPEGCSVMYFERTCNPSLYKCSEFPSSVSSVVCVLLYLCVPSVVCVALPLCALSSVLLYLCVR
ncbi:hypothetical protein FHG87_022304 [Trinorchestia longiramus]|nr:hypothetical protein FHG87_022304 [Trinorchestia longiramus]